jgi:2-methylcitrate dehydratase PrpD
MSTSPTSSPTPGEILAQFASRVQTTPLPPAVHHKALVQILDTLGAISSGSALEAGLIGQRYVSAMYPPLPGTSSGYTSVQQQASVLGTDIKVPLVEAALANGMAAHADESDDSHETSQTHPGCGVAAALLAVAEWRASSGEEFVRAYVLAYEIAIRFGESFVGGRRVVVPRWLLSLRCAQQRYVFLPLLL